VGSVYAGSGFSIGHRVEVKTMTTFVTLTDGTRVRVAIAITPADKTRGLTGVTLPWMGIYGMIFVWTDENPRVITMEGCLIPLDIVWLDGQRNVLAVMTGKPGKGTYQAMVYAMFVLELGAGECEKHGVEIGSQLVF
jgi:uncharacterized membrane protein (UPF0127 family)